MSTDLHLNHELPKLRVTVVDTNDVLSDQTDDGNTNTHVKPDDEENTGAGNGTGGDDSYKTPTSKESRIPAILTCPAAPRKGKPSVSCKRKLLNEFQFFEGKNKDEMDALFRSTFPKRSCRCT